MDNIGGWLEAFSVYCLVLTSLFPPLLEGSLTLPAVDLVEQWPVHYSGLVSVRSGLPQSCSCDKFETGQLLMPKRSTPCLFNSIALRHYLD